MDDVKALRHAFVHCQARRLGNARRVAGEIVDRVGMSVELVPHMVDGDGKLLGQRAIFAYWRNGSKILSSAAFRKLRVGEGS